MIRLIISVSEEKWSRFAMFVSATNLAHIACYDRGIEGVVTAMLYVRCEKYKTFVEYVDHEVRVGHYKKFVMKAY